jgi:periplasmic protein TonB
MKTLMAAICFLLISASAGMAQATHKLSHAEALAAVSAKVPPVYPPIARQLKIEGAVEVEAMVGEDGQVESVNIVSGNPMLTKPAVEAIRKWKFPPQVQDGKPARAIAPITLNFKM